jgi:flagellar M-ring protein FliF
MDALRKTFAQYVDLFRSMSPSQRGTLVVVPLMVLAALAFLMFRNGSSSDVAVSFGKTFTTEEIINAEQTLKEKGLGDFRREGRQILVPAADVEKYNAALLEAGSLPDNWAEELEKQIENKSIFASRDELLQMKEIALQKQLDRVLDAIPGIENADVLWDRPRQRRFGGPAPRVTALVSVRPRAGRELSRQLVESLRAAVAGMNSELTVKDVTVFDESTGTAYAPDQEGDPFDSGLMQRVREFTRNYEQQIAQALNYIPDAAVTVNVDLENIKSSTERSTKVNPKETVALQNAEVTRNENLREQPSRAEPGNVSNRPRQLELAAGQERTRTTTETNSQSVSATASIVTDRELIAAMPRAVQVSVAVPEDYYRAVAVKRGLAEGTTDAEKQEFQKAVEAIRLEEEKKVKATVLTLIPAGSPDSAIHVSSVVRLDTEAPAAATPWTLLVTDFIAEWGGSIALALFALWALRLVNRGLPRASAEPEPAVVKPPQPEDDRKAEQELKKAVEATARDELQSSVRDNPEMAAAVLMKWLQAAK